MLKQLTYFIVNERGIVITVPLFLCNFEELEI